MEGFSLSEIKREIKEFNVTYTSEITKQVQNRDTYH